jgi:DNA-binding NarL/FixJ family response regulator
MLYTLLVDENVGFRHALSDVLHAYFPLIDVEETGDVTKAQSMVEYLRPNIVLMDIQLPEGCGLEISKEIRQIYNDIVMVILTNNNQPEYRQKALRDGTDYCISKGEEPCMEKILTLIEGVLDSRMICSPQ